MIENFGLIKDRISAYTYVPDRQFRTSSGRSVEEESIAQKLRQFWADDSVSNSSKLEGFEFDLSGFDPMKTSSRELIKISLALEKLGIVDQTTGSWLGRVGSEFNDQGNQINMDKKTNAFEYFNNNLEFIKGYIAEGHDFAKDTLTGLNTVITVMLALQERAQASRTAGMIDDRV
jgi:hypothetical protein